MADPVQERLNTARERLNTVRDGAVPSQMRVSAAREPQDTTVQERRTTAQERHNTARDEGGTMTDVRPGGNRRIDRVLGPGYLDGLEALPLDVLRRRRRDAETEEADLSYLRRLLHGRIDIVRAEQARRQREQAAGGSPGAVIDELPSILAGGPRTGRPFGRVRHLVAEPPRSVRNRRRVERLVANVDLSDVSARTDDELERVLRTYQEEERRVSDVRSRVQEALDLCSAELTRRYAQGEVAVADVLRARSVGGASQA